MHRGSPRRQKRKKSQPTLDCFYTKDLVQKLCPTGDPTTSPTYTKNPAPQLTQSSSSGYINSPICPGKRSRWDQLEDAVSRLDALGYPARFDAGGGWELFELLGSNIFVTRRSYRRFLLYRGTVAQLLVNSLQWLLRNHPSLEGQGRKTILQALLRLSKHTKLLPNVYFLEGIQTGNVVFQTPTVDIYQGTTAQGRLVCLKRYRNWKQTQESRDYMTDMIIRETILLYNHPNPGILPFEGIMQMDGDFEQTFLVSPFFKYGSTLQYLARNPDVDRLKLFRDIVSAVAYLHTHNIVHGDIKGCNVLVDEDGHAVLGDLGLSRLSDAQLITWTSIQTMNASLGTLPWLAPELLNVHQPNLVPTAASDIYALGCLAYEIFTGQAPFWEISSRSTHYHWYAAQQISQKVRDMGCRPSKPPPGSDAYKHYGLTEEVWNMMEACWVTDPKLRPSASELLSDRGFLVHAVDRRVGGRGEGV